MLVGSLVVREASLSDLKPAWRTCAVSVRSFVFSPRRGADRLTPGEFALVDSFLNRRSALKFDVRNRMADEILRRLKPKLTLPSNGSLSRSILESLAYERRATGRYS